LANEALWSDFETFEQLSYEAFQKAQDAGQAPPDEMLDRVVELEAMCDGCHEAYRKPFEYFDFDRVDEFIDAQ
jgi:cytochrome c556